MNFNQMLIHHCAPTICNIKPGNIFFVQNRLYSKVGLEAWRKESSKLGISLFSVRISKTSRAILALNVGWAADILRDGFVKEYLEGKGYAVADARDFVRELFCMMLRGKGFPHEVGIILGYPLADVIEFENHKGHDCKFCGCWKSYSDVENARRCLCEYKECMGVCEAWYDEGYSLSQIVTAYRKLSAA